uniref:CSON001297 protein n=1 Tax=Culicoides sonorensis TaxID=179676 RepID=A0A336MGD7_CULSO
MAKPHMTSCCCYSLRTGTIITGVLGIILAIITLILIFTTRAEFKTFIMDWLPSSVVKIIIALNLAMTILISILLIFGAMKRNHYLMLPWVILGIMLAIGLLISGLYTGIMLIIDGFVLAGVLWIIIGLFVVGVFIFLWVVVFSYFSDLKDENDRGRYAKQPYRR